MARKLDARQTIIRDYLDQLTLSSSWGPAVTNEKPTFSTELDNLLRSLNSETTDPIRLRANYPNNLAVNLDAAVITNLETQKNRIPSPIDSTIGKDMDDVFAGGTITFGATLWANVAVSGAGTGLPNLTALFIGAAGHGSVGVFIDSVGNIALSASQGGALLTEPLPFPVVKPGLALIGMIEVEFDASDNIVFFDDSKLFQFTNPDSNTLRDVVAQDRNTMLVGGGTWAWDHSGRNEIQRFAFSGATPDAGSFTIDLGGDTTAAIPFTATAADVEAAIETGIAAITDVKVDGSFDSDFTVEFVGVDGNAPYAQMTTISLLTSSLAPTIITYSTDQEGSAIGAGNLTFSEDAIIHVPGVEVQQNTISFAASSPIVLQDDEVAYVNLNRDLEATGLVNLPVTVASIDSNSILGNDVFIIARRYNSDALIADTFKLENQESQSLEASASDQTLQYIGAFNEADALPDYGSTNIVAQNDDLTTAISKLDAGAGIAAGQINQDRNIKMIGGGTWLWDQVAETLYWSNSAYIQVPGLDDDRNQISSGAANLTAGVVAYIELNRASDLPTVRPIILADISDVPTTDDVVIIARRVGNDVIVGTHCFRLRDGQSLELDGALQEIRRLNDQLKVVVLSAVDEVGILPADISQLDLVNGTPSTLVLEIGGVVLNFDGGVANFATGVISGAPGTNFTPAVIPVGEYQWYSLSLDGLALDATNRTTAVVRVGVASAPNAVQASAPYADFEGTRPLGQVQVQNIGGTITVVDIRRLGGGSGSAGWRTKVITAAYAADAGEELLVDTTGSAYAITLPLTPRDGSRVRIKDREKTFATNNLTLVTLDGSTIDGDPSPYIFDKEGAWAECVFDANDDEWKLFLSLPGSFTVVPVSSAYAAKDLEDVVADTSGGAFAVTLPTSPSDGVRVRVKDAEGTFYTNAVSVTTVGPFTLNGAASPFVMSTDNTWAEFVYVASSSDWEVYSPLVGNVDWRVRTLTATATAVDHDELMCDTSGGSFTINLPASPTEGTRVRFKDSTANFEMHPLSIATTDGASIEGFVSPFEFDVERTWAELVYVSASDNWQILSPLVGDIDWRTATLTANYTAVNDDELMCNTTGGAFTVTLPDGASITDGTRVRVKDYGDSFNAFNLSIATVDGSTIEGTAQPLLMDEDGSWAEFVWVFALQDWRVFTPIVGGGWQSIVIDNSAGTYTSFDEQEIFADTSSGVVTIDLPAAPTLGHRLRFIDHDGSWNTTNATVNGNGNNINGSATLVLNVADAWVEVVFNGVEWRVLSQ
jgi:hypothetical protein